jgi:hypothetical protein
MQSGALFLCDDARGACTTAVGGGPLLGHATISLVPAQTALPRAPSTLEEFAHAAADKEKSSQFSAVASLAGSLVPIRYLVVSQTYTAGARNEVPQLIYRYFAEADHQMIELILAFNSGDKQSQVYRETALKIITSLQLKP